MCHVKGELNYLSDVGENKLNVFYVLSMHSITNINSVDSHHYQ